MYLEIFVHRVEAIAADSPSPLLRVIVLDRCEEGQTDQGRREWGASALNAVRHHARDGRDTQLVLSPPLSLIGGGRRRRTLFREKEGE